MAIKDRSTEVLLPTTALYSINNQLKNCQPIRPPSQYMKCYSNPGSMSLIDSQYRMQGYTEEDIQTRKYAEQFDNESTQPGGQTDKSETMDDCSKNIYIQARTNLNKLMNNLGQFAIIQGRNHRDLAKGINSTLCPPQDFDSHLDLSPLE